MNNKRIISAKPMAVPHRSGQFAGILSLRRRAPQSHATIALALLAVSWLPLAALGAPPTGGFDKLIQPLLQTHCYRCHGEKKQEAGVDLSKFKTERDVLKQYKLWRHVLVQVETEEMPPDDDTGFNDQNRHILAIGIQQTLALLESDHPSLRDPGPGLIRRLSRAEYNNALRDLLGLNIDAASAVGMQEDSTGSSFDNIASALNIPLALMEKYFAAADTALARLFGDADAKSPDKKKDKAALEALLTGISSDRAGARTFLSRFVHHAWRRPVTDVEVERFVKVFDDATANGDAFLPAIRKAMKPVLVSPYFLFRIEEDRSPAGAANVITRVSDVELASRLSFFLWSSIPDEELLVLAENNQLSAPANLDRQVQRMLADPKAKALTTNFFARWLQLGRLATARPSTEFFPTFNQKLKKAMRDEVEIFCDKLREEDRPVLDILNADYTFVNEDLARHYGLAGVKGEQTQRVTLLPEHHRGGVLGMAGILSLTSHTSRTSPTQRGKWVLDVIFGTPPKPPPANVSQIDDKKKNAQGQEPKNFREKLALHAADAVCAGCHRKIDPLGFGLENYNAIGEWRASGGDINATGELPGGITFDGAAELKQILWERRDEFLRNLIGEMLAYALGRQTDYYDEHQITKIKSTLDKEGGQFSALVQGIVDSYAFQHRRNADPLPNAPASQTNPAK